MSALPPNDPYPPLAIWQELLSHLVNPKGQSEMVQALLRGAVFKPQAMILLRHGCFVAQLDFVEPVGPDRQDGLVLMLNVHPEREA